MEMRLEYYLYLYKKHFTDKEYQQRLSSQTQATYFTIILLFYYYIFISSWIGNSVWNNPDINIVIPPINNKNWPAHVSTIKS